jgi:ABC-type sugar transport system permease subunit
VLHFGYPLSEATLPVTATPRRSRFQIDKTAIIAYAFIAPAVFGFLIFLSRAHFRAIYISFTDWNLMRVPQGGRSGQLRPVDAR